MTTTRPKETSIDDLSKDIMGLITKQLPLKDVVQLKSTNRTIRTNVHSATAPTEQTYGTIFQRLNELQQDKANLQENIKLIAFPKYAGAMLAAGLSAYAIFTITQLMADYIQEDCIQKLVGMVSQPTGSNSASEYWKIQSKVVESALCFAHLPGVLPWYQAATGFVAARYSTLYALLWADRKAEGMERLADEANQEINQIITANSPT